MDLISLKKQFLHSSSLLDQDFISLWPWVRDHFIHKRFLGSDLREEINRIVSELSKGMPIQYALGWAPFMNLIVDVDSSVLIPRSETEELVYAIQQHYADDYSGVIMDVGTGSGAIAIALSIYFKNAHVIATDLSPSALMMARQNASKCEADVSFVQDDFLEPVQGLYENVDLFVSNPPYIGSNEQEHMDITVRNYEPEMALYGPSHDPLLFYRLLAERFSRSSNIWVEMNALQSDEIQQIFKKEGSNRVEVLHDLQGLPRIVHSKPIS